MSSKLLDDLPALFREDEFAGRFLLAFEKLLLGREDGVAFPDVDAAFRHEGLEQTIAGLWKYFDANLTPAEFLPWLASWVALSQRADLPVAQQRAFLGKIVQSYRMRGTPANLIDLLRTFTQTTPTLRDQGSEAPHCFSVDIRIPDKPKSTAGTAAEREAREAEWRAFVTRQTAIARALIEFEKPAHTQFQLNPVYPSLQIGESSTVEVDTLLGTAL